MDSIDPGGFEVNGRELTVNPGGLVTTDQST